MLSMADQRRRQLEVIDRLARTLARARNLTRVKAVRDNAELARMKARTARLGLEVENAAAELKLRAERRGGQLMAASFSHGGDRRSNSNKTTRHNLTEFGINRSQSARWRRAAAVSDQQFESYLAGAKRRGERITSADLLRVEEMSNYK